MAFSPQNSNGKGKNKMGNFTQRDFTGALFKNEKKENERHPEFNGSAVIDGRAYWVAGFVKTAESGKRWTSLAFTPKEKQQSRKIESGEEKPKPAHRPPPPPPAPADPDASAEEESEPPF